MKLNNYRKIPPNSSRDDIQLALQTLTDFMHTSTIISGVTNTLALQEYQSINNLSLLQIIDQIDMVIVMFRKKMRGLFRLSNDFLFLFEELS